jgi:hypothetical protein
VDRDRPPSAVRLRHVVVARTAGPLRNAADARRAFFGLCGRSSSRRRAAAVCDIYCRGREEGERVLTPVPASAISLRKEERIRISCVAAGLTSVSANQSCTPAVA